MTLGKQMMERLRLLAGHGPEVAQVQPVASASHTLQVMLCDEAHSAKLAFFDHDRYSITLSALDVGTNNQSATQDARAYLSARAAEIIRHLSYLEEPLAVWELDGSEQVAQLRSVPPQRENDEVSFWEVILWASPKPHAQIMRYRWSSGMVEREVAAYPATFALVARLIDSLAAALTSAE